MPRNLGASQQFMKFFAVFIQNENRKNIIVTRKKLLGRRNFLSQQGISCHKNDFFITGRYFLSHEDNSYYSKKFAITRSKVMSKLLTKKSKLKFMDD